MEPVPWDPLFALARAAHVGGIRPQGHCSTDARSRVTADAPAAPRSPSSSGRVSIRERQCAQCHRRPCRVWAPDCRKKGLAHPQSGEPSCRRKALVSRITRRRAMRFSPLGLIAALAAAVSAPACRPSQPVASGPLEISLSGRADTVTIIGSNVSRAAILEELRARHGVEVRAEVPEERISPRIVGVPLAAGIEQLLPPGTRYALRIAEADRQIGILPRTGEKRGAHDLRPDSLPTKDETRPFPRSPDARLKQAPERAGVPQEVRGPGRKPPADSTIRVPEGRGPRLELPAAAQDSSLRLSFRIMAPDSIRLVDARLVAGSSPLARNVQGPLLFAFRVAGRVVHFGAL